MGVDTKLTESQLAAVDHFEGPLLVVAGPGSGKTRVITRRIARLIDRGVHPDEILAITFTNKAARVMSERVQSLLPRSFVWVSTFHRLCARLLRQYASVVGLSPNFSIYDVADQTTLMKGVLHEMDIDSTHFPPAKLLGKIGKLKNELVTADVYAARQSLSVGNHLDAVVARVYPAYQKQLLESNAVDFDDLLMLTVEVLKRFPEAREKWEKSFRYVLVDEYQDTNHAQYTLLQLLTAKHRNLMVVGDPDQSVYGFRGADIRNILEFEKDYKDTRVIPLEQSSETGVHRGG